MFVINDLRVGGAERVFSDDANALAKRGHKVSICLLYGSFESDPFAKNLVSEIERIEIHARGPFDMTALGRFRTAILRTRPDACVSTLNDANLFARSGLIGMRRVRYLRREANELSAKPWWHKLIDLLLDWRMDDVIAVSENLRHSIAASNPWVARKITVLPNAVAVSDMSHIEGDRFLILSVGSLTAKKDHATLIRACGLLQKRRIGFSLVIVGEGSERTNLESLVHAMGLTEVVSFTGRLDHAAVQEWYRNASVFVLTSRIEGSPNVLLEAMAAGLPSVASDIPSVREVLDAESGVLVPPGESQAFADALERFSADTARRARMGVHARGVIRQRFDPKSRLEKLEVILYGKTH